MGRIHDPPLVASRETISGETAVTKRPSERLTDKVVRALPCPPCGSIIHYDGELPGFGARVTAKGVRSFVLNYVAGGRERRTTIGQFPVWSATAAREEARALRRKVDAGIDPMDERAGADAEAAAKRGLPTVTDLFTRYSLEHLPRKSPRAASDDRSMWHKIILPRLGKTKVADLTHSDVDALHSHVRSNHPVRANRVVEVLRKALNLAVRWGWRSDNPASGVHRSPEPKRTRYLAQPEFIRLWHALVAHPERTSAAAIQVLMLTGARRSEVLSAQWNMFDLDQCIWTKPSSHTKQRKEHRVPISTPVRNILRELTASAPGPYVFTGRTGGPLTDVKRTWATVCKSAGIFDCRLHDLRHTYASVLASAGNSLPVIGALLGHTQTQTTARYAHLFDDPLRAATEHVGAIFLPPLMDDIKMRSPALADGD